MGTLEEVFEVPIISHGKDCQGYTKLSWIGPKTITWLIPLFRVIGEKFQSRLMMEIFIFHQMRLVRMTTQSRLMYPPASLLRKDDNEEDDIDDDIPEEYVLKQEANSVASCAVEMGGDGRGDKNMGIRLRWKPTVCLLAVTMIWLLMIVLDVVKKLLSAKVEMPCNFGAHILGTLVPTMSGREHSSTIYLWFLPDIKVMVEARNSHVQDGESDGDANLLSPEWNWTWLQLVHNPWDGH
ncbi:hypothetical protein CK203_077649 [Vitis vinifera]|uniref:Uncharacterized protein n=1 Tax=Vitis vinifera TaxID=29760 RepID=A0A438ETH5_VITVI|nr:hypothetical protein CK203_077649 [Vitis vinifera]